MENSGIKHRGAFICFVARFVYKHSGVTWNLASSDDVCSHKRCHSETYAYVFYKEHVSPYHVTRVTSNNAIRFGSILMSLFRTALVAFWNI